MQLPEALVAAHLADHPAPDRRDLAAAWRELRVSPAHGRGRRWLAGPYPEVAYGTTRLACAGTSRLEVLTADGLHRIATCEARGRVSEVAVSPGDRWVSFRVHRGPESWLLLLDLMEGRFLDLGDDGAGEFAFAADESALFARSRHHLTAWDLPAGTRRFQVEVDAGPVHLGVRPDGAVLVVLAAGDRRHPARLLAIDASDGLVLAEGPAARVQPAFVPSLLGARAPHRPVPPDLVAAAGPELVLIPDGPVLGVDEARNLMVWVPDDDRGVLRVEQVQPRRSRKIRLPAVLNRGASRRRVALARDGTRLAVASPWTLQLLELDDLTRLPSHLDAPEVAMSVEALLPRREGVLAAVDNELVEVEYRGDTGRPRQLRRVWALGARAGGGVVVGAGAQMWRSRQSAWLDRVPLDTVREPRTGAVSADGRWLAFAHLGSPEGRVDILEVDTARPIAILEGGHSQVGTPFFLGPRGFLTASGAWLVAWDLPEGTERWRRRFRPHAWLLAVSEDGSQALAQVGGQGGPTLYLLRGEDGEGDPFDVGVSVEAATFLPDGQAVVLAGADRGLRWLDLRTRTVKVYWDAQGVRPGTLVCSADRRRLYTGAADGSVGAWDLEQLAARAARGRG